MTRRYVLHPGTVRSKNDRQIHYITAQQLARLYGVSLRECVVYPEYPRSLAWSGQPDDVNLYPREDGNYTLSELEK